CDVKEVLKEEERRESSARDFTPRCKVNRKQGRDDQFEQGAAPESQGGSEPSKQKMARLMNNQIDMIDQKKAAAASERVEQKQSVENQPRYQAWPRDRFPVVAHHRLPSPRTGAAAKVLTDEP